jgi:hypothetical protein
MTGATLDTGALIALESGSTRMAVLVQEALAGRAELAVPAGVLAHPGGGHSGRERGHLRERPGTSRHHQRSRRYRRDRPGADARPANMTPEPKTTPQRSALFGGFVAEDTGGQHDVTGPAAGPAEADEYAILPGPVLADKPLPAVGQRQGRGAPRAVPGRVPAVPLRVQGKPAAPDVAARGDVVAG